MLILLFNCQTPLFRRYKHHVKKFPPTSNARDRHPLAVILFLCYDGCARGESGESRHDQSDYHILTQKKTQPHGTFYKHDSLFDMFQAISLS